MVKVTSSDVVSRLESLHPGQYQLLEYGNGRVTVLCKQCYHQWSDVLLGNILKENRNCPNCNKISRTISRIKKWNHRLEESGKSSLVVVSYNPTEKGEMRVLCKDCNSYFYSRNDCLPTHCVNCSKYQRSNVFQFYQRTRLVGNHYCIHNPELFTSANQKVTVTCQDCGYEFTANGRSLTVARCLRCSGSAKTTEMVSKEVLEKTDGSIELRSEYTNGQTKALFYCNVCQHTFKNKPFNILIGGSRCPICYESKGERAIRKYLEDNGIEFEAQKVFPSCRLKLPLPFDFYVNKSLLVEFDGPQHYSPNMLMNRREGFQAQKARDDTKTWWAHKHGYTLIRIKYEQMELIPHILEKEIQRSIARRGSKQEIQISRYQSA